MPRYVLTFQEIDKTLLPVVGGKGANLGELSRIDGIRVPEGFCVTTEAYQRVIGGHSEIAALLGQLSPLRLEDSAAISEISAQIRRAIEMLTIPSDMVDEISRHLAKLGEQNAFAIRSSATAEDLPLASFAGQQDTYLNIRGKDSILRYVRKCWASLFTDRAVTYRIQNQFEHNKVYLSVVVQRMVLPAAAGIMFTADPVTANRKVLSIDASFGLGEALVSGLVNADLYKVREGKIMSKKVSTKRLAVYALADGGTEERQISPEQQNMQTLTDEQILQLERMGRKIEAHFGCPQDIEWCLADDTFFVVQSRPITTLYPVPSNPDEKLRVYLSYGHRQMMTDAFKPLGISFFMLLDEWLGRPAMSVAGGRFWKDMSHELTSWWARPITLKSMAMVDVLMQNALTHVTQRKEIMQRLARGKASVLNFGRGGVWPMLIQFMKLSRQNDSAAVRELIANNNASVRRLQQNIATKSGDELFAFIIEDHKELTDIMFEPRSVAAAFVGINAANWINKHMDQWLGERNSADILAQSAPNNVVAEMGLDLLDVADLVRQSPAVMAYLQNPSDETFFADLAKLEGGPAVSNAMRGYLERHGMHCPGDIDITRPRWGEKPTLLIPLILSNIQNFEPNARRTRHERGLLEAEQKKKELLSRLAQLPGGHRKARKAERQISLLRNFIGYREYSKHACLQRYYLYKEALLKEAAKLVQKGLIREQEDVLFLSLEEFREVVRTGRLDYALITARKAEHEVNEKLSPRRVMTSEGEVISGEYDAGKLPPGALAGVPVSAGTIEGRARVVLKMEDASIEAGDILVTVFTDPSWSPLFVSVKGVVTEVGGMMTHGAVIAREYGLPAVVGVENATKRIKDGQRIRVNGTDGYVEIL